MNKMVNIRTLTSRILILTSAVVFTFCKDDDEASAPQATYTINGESQKAQTITAVLQFQMQYGHEGRALNINFIGTDGEILSVAVSNWDFQNPPDNGILTGEYDAAWDYENSDEENPLANCLMIDGSVALCDGGLISLMSNTDFYSSVFDGNTDASITVSKCDAGNRTVSGTFAAKIAGFDGAQPSTITGTFENVKYIVQ